MYPVELTTSLRTHELKTNEVRAVTANEPADNLKLLQITILVGIVLGSIFIYFESGSAVKISVLGMSLGMLVGQVLSYWQINSTKTYALQKNIWIGYGIQMVLVLLAPLILTSNVSFWLLALPATIAVSAFVHQKKQIISLIIVFSIVSALGRLFVLSPVVAILMPFFTLLSSGIISFLVHTRMGPLSAQLQHAISHLNLETAKRKQLSSQLEKVNHELDHRIEERMIALMRINQALQREVQDRRNAENKALEASRIKSSFLANMSHELRTPLNAIIGYTEMMLEDSSESDRLTSRNDLQNVQSAARNLLAIVDDILDLSKIEAGKMDIRVETFLVADLIENVATTIAPLVQKNHNTLKLKYSKALGDIKTDRTKLNQILTNLLSNACKFTEHGRIELYVETTVEDGRTWFKFSVSDTGIGIAPETLERLFTPFTQADDSPTRKYGGTGLGLALSQHFCHMLGGDISAESVLGKGSVFRVRMPSEPLDPRLTGVVMESLY